VENKSEISDICGISKLLGFILTDQYLQSFGTGEIKAVKKINMTTIITLLMVKDICRTMFKET